MMKRTNILCRKLQLVVSKHCMTAVKSTLCKFKRAWHAPTHNNAETDLEVHVCIHSLLNKSRTHRGVCYFFHPIFVEVMTFWLLLSYVWNHAKISNAYGSNPSQLPKRDNLYIKDKRLAPNLSIIQKLYCTDTNTKGKRVHYIVEYIQHTVE